MPTHARDTEDQLAVIGCLERSGYCCIERVCVLRCALREATDAFLAILDAHTLADLIKPQRVLSSLLLDRRTSVPSKARKHCYQRHRKQVRLASSIVSYMLRRLTAQEGCSLLVCTRKA
jgi:hypothetical protein